MGGNRVVDPAENRVDPVADGRPADSRVAVADLTIIVPTYNEGPNVGALVHRLSAALHDRSVEILFVDDSSDDTPEQIVRAAAEAVLPVRMIHRGRRTGSEALPAR